MKRYLLIFLIVITAGSLFAQTPTVSDLSPNGGGIKWYSLSSGGTLYTGTEELVNGQHYYASQTVNGVESTARLDVTAHLDPNTVSGAVTGGYAISSGATSGLLSLGTHTGTITKWQYTVSPFNSWSDISYTNDTYTSGTLSATTQFRALVKSGACNEVASDATTVSIGDVAITTLPVTSFASTTADLSLQGTGTGITVIGFKYHTSSGFDPSNTGTDASHDFSPGTIRLNPGITFTINTGVFSPATTYYVRAYATDGTGTTYGNEESFTTSGS